MSYPRLLITGTPGTYIIDTISLVYDNDSSGLDKPKHLTRAKYDVRRELVNLNVNSAVPNKKPDIPYDHFRYIHTWIGYADVLTQSVALHPSSGGDTAKNLVLIKTALFMDSASVTNPEYTVKSLLVGDVGPSNPSLGGSYVEAEEVGLSWKYDQNDEELTISNWVIQDINIQDNQNNTSRFTITLNQVSPFIKIADIV